MQYSFVIGYLPLSSAVVDLEAEESGFAESNVPSLDQGAYVHTMAVCLWLHRLLLSLHLIPALRFHPPVSLLYTLWRSPFAMSIL